MKISWTSTWCKKKETVNKSVNTRSSLWLGGARTSYQWLLSARLTTLSHSRFDWHLFYLAADLFRFIFSLWENHSINLHDTNSLSTCKRYPVGTISLSNKWKKKSLQNSNKLLALFTIIKHIKYLLSFWISNGFALVGSDFCHVL